MRGGEIGAARVGDGRNLDAALLRRQLRPALQPFDAGDTQRLGVRHNVSLRHRYEILRAEISPDLDLMLDRPLPQRARRAAPNFLLFVSEAHSSNSGLWASMYS